MLIVNVVNIHETKTIPTDIVLQTGENKGSVIVNEVTGTSITSKNANSEQQVNIYSKELNVKGEIIHYKFHHILSPN